MMPTSTRRRFYDYVLFDHTLDHSGVDRVDNALHHSGKVGLLIAERVESSKPSGSSSLSVAS